MYNRDGVTVGGCKDFEIALLMMECGDAAAAASSFFARGFFMCFSFAEDFYVCAIISFFF
jgi:hypothetical protein